MTEDTKIQDLAAEAKQIEADEIEKAKMEAYTNTPPIVGGIQLRPFTAGTCGILRVTGNALLTGGTVTDMEYAAQEFIYVHAAPLAEVTSVYRDKNALALAVTSFWDKLSIKELLDAIPLIEPIIHNAIVSAGFEKPKETTEKKSRKKTPASGSPVTQ
jgi:hypothetical protein